MCNFHFSAKLFSLVVMNDEWKSLLHCSFSPPHIFESITRIQILLPLILYVFISESSFSSDDAVFKLQTFAVVITSESIFIVPESYYATHRS